MLINTLLIILAVIVAVWLLGIVLASAWVIACVVHDVRAERRQRNAETQFDLAALYREFAKNHRTAQR